MPSEKKLLKIISLLEELISLLRVDVTTLGEGDPPPEPPVTPPGKPGDPTG